jgi:hypothetical protein
MDVPPAREKSVGQQTSARIAGLETIRMTRALHPQIETFDGIKSVQSARRKAKHDASASGKLCNDAGGLIWSTEG